MHVRHVGMRPQLKHGILVALGTYAATYLERHSRLMHELMDVGLMLEAESNTLYLCRDLLLFRSSPIGNRSLYWPHTISGFGLLRPLGDLMYMVTVPTHQRNLIPDVTKCVQALFLVCFTAR